MEIEGNLQQLEKGKCHIHIHESPIGSCGEVQTSQPHLGAWENHAASPLGAYFWAHEEQEGDEKQSAWFYQGCIVLDPVIKWLDL